MNNPVFGVNTYYTGVFKKDNNILTEVPKALSGSAIEDYFPLVVENLTKRGNWKKLNTHEAFDTHEINLCWSNTSVLNAKANVQSRILLDSVKHYISDKGAFYNKFNGNDFIPDFIDITKANLEKYENDLRKKFTNMPVIIKPNAGSVGIDILVQDVFDYNAIQKHINQSKFNEWTISEIIKSKLIDGYIHTNRIYFVVVKLNNNRVESYYYDEFMNYRAENKFTGDITDPLQFVTNYYVHTLDGDREFVKNRFISHKKWLESYSHDEIDYIYRKLDLIFNNITDMMQYDILCANDNKKRYNDNDILGFHVYGADIIIDNKLNIKVIELNGAPSMNIKTRLYEVDDRLDYFELFDDLFKITVDRLYPPLMKRPLAHKFRNVFMKNIINLPKELYYIPNSIIQTYPFIYEALNKRPYLKRTRNVGDNISVFYGLRERYVDDKTSLVYYDELLNHTKSQHMRNAGIINKIQGVTYYMANKGRIYDKLIKYDSNAFKYHPVSETFYYDGKTNMFDLLQSITKKYKSVNKWILKPVHGSRGTGIKVFNKKKTNLFKKIFKNSDELTIGMLEHINKYTTEGVDIEHKVLSKFNGIETTEILNQKYNYWIISQYIDNPHLIYEKKYNIRFYVLLTLNGKLPTYEDLTTLGDKKSPLEAYIFNDCMIYFAMLKYKDNNIPAQYSKLDPELIDRMRSLTNLEIINEVSKFADINIDAVKKESTSMLSLMMNTKQFSNIMMQGTNIIKQTINAVKYDLRPLNRFADNYKGAFNLLAYDTLLDDQNKLWFIEINRGPDLKGLQMNIGNEHCGNMFDEIFKITLDHNTDNLKYFTKIPVDYNIVNI